MLILKNYFRVFTWNGKHDQNTVKEVYELTNGFCVDKENKYKIVGEKNIPDNRYIQCYCSRNVNPTFTIRLKRLDNIILAEKDFTFDMEKQRVEFPTITLRTPELIDKLSETSVNNLNFNADEKLKKTYKLSWSSGESFGSSELGQKPCFQTFLLIKVTRKGEVQQSSYENCIDKLTEITGSNNKVLEISNDNCNQYHISKLLDTATTEYMVSDLIDLEDKDKLEVNIITRFSKFSDDNNKNSGTIELSEPTTDTYTVCIPSVTRTTKISASPYICLDKCNDINSNPLMNGGTLLLRICSRHLIDYRKKSR